MHMYAHYTLNTHVGANSGLLEENAHHGVDVKVLLIPLELEPPSFVLGWWTNWSAHERHA